MKFLFLSQNAAVFINSLYFFIIIYNILYLRIEISQSCSVSVYSVDFQREHLEGKFLSWVLPVIVLPWWWYFTLPWHSMCHLQICEVTALDSWPESTIFLSNWSERETETSFLLLLPFFFLCPQECHHKQNNMQKKPKKSSPAPLCLHTMTIQMFSSVRLSCSIPWGKPYCPFKSILLPLIFTGRNTIHNACI